MTLKIWIVFFSGTTPRSLVRGYKFFRETCYLQLQTRRQRQLQSRQWKQQFISRCQLSFTRLNYVITRWPHYKANSHRAGKEIPPHFAEHIHCYFFHNGPLLVSVLNQAVQSAPSQTIFPRPS